jgi:hypothetical protein
LLLPDWQHTHFLAAQQDIHVLPKAMQHKHCLALVLAAASALQHVHALPL